MRCDACDVILTEREDARRFTGSGARVGLCNSCASWLPDDLEREDANGVKEIIGEADDGFLPWDEEGSYEEEDSFYNWDELEQ